MNIKILPELKNLIPPLTPNEFAQLEANCIQYGIQDKLKVWCSGFYCTGCGNEISFSKEEIKRAWYDAHSICEKDLLPSHEAELFTLGKGCDDCGDVRAVDDGIDANIVLLDGHNRYAIAQKNNLPFEVEYLDFEGLNDAKLWMIDNQKGRRNLTDFVKFELAQVKAEILKEKGREKMSESRAKAWQEQKEGLSIIDKPSNEQPHNTREEIAKELGWSSGKIAMSNVVNNEADEETKNKLRRNEVSINQVYKEIKKERRKKEIEKQKQEIQKLKN